MAAGSIGNQWFRGIAYKLTPRISKLSTLLYLNILFSLFLDVLFNDSIPSFIQFAGALFVIASAVVPILIRSDKKQMEQKQVANG